MRLDTDRDPRPPAPFAANDLPLGPGRLLLEASAGTGKTFALAHLVLRLVAERGLPLRELLVVTFTEAAAAELRDRIGRRLQQALAALEQPGSASPDAVLADWLARTGQGGAAAERLRGRLLLALESLDGADVTTIHGFCLRSLGRHALEAGRPPQPQLQRDASTLVEEVVHDYWLRQVLPLPPGLLEGLRQRRLGPERLVDLVLRLDGDPALGPDPPDPALPPELPLPERLPALLRERWRAFEREWRARGEDLERALRDAAGRWKAAGSPSKKYSPRPRSDRVGALDTWLDGLDGPPDYDLVLGQDLLRDHFHPGQFCQEARRAEGADAAPRLPEEPLLRAVAALVDGPAELVLRHAAHVCHAELRRRRRQAGVIGFSQLLEALDPGPDAAGPTPLLAAVGRRYRVALIDEFQDTDPIQWRLLRLAFSGPEHQLVMVGDPKQAIYRFRGGDLNTYLQARREARDCLGLNENRRSTAALIEGLDRLMRPGGLPRSGLPVPPVLARADRCGPGGHPIELLWLGADRPAGDPLPSRSEIEQRLPGLIAAHCAELLARGLRITEGGEGRALAAADVCLLVSTHRQAERLRVALRERGIASRLLSRADVFATAAATALQRLLDALADPADAGRLRLLAASPLLGWSADAIASADAERWSRLAAQVDRLAARLPAVGLPAVLAALLGSGSLARLALGGRFLADLQQLAELVQERIHAERLGVAAAADWLRRRRGEAGRRGGDPPEEHQAHSDREDGAVAVVTVHASKGLEYPVVFCPYLWQDPEGGGDRLGVRWQPPDAPGPRLDLHLDGRWGVGRLARRRERLEEAAERERLAYVAVTRASHLLVLAWAPVAKQQGGPLFAWLFPDEPLPELGDDPQALGARSDAGWRERLEWQIRQRGLPLRLLDAADGLPAEAVATVPPPPERLSLGTGPVPQRRLDTSWGRSSYSGWTHAAQAARDPAAREEGRDTGDPVPDPLQPSAAADPGADGGTDPGADDRVDGGNWPEQGPLAEFPRGPVAGECLHRILERLDYERRFDDPDQRALVERELRRAGLPELAAEEVVIGLERMRRTPFGGELGGFRLACLARERRLNEMSFDLSLGHATAEALAAAFADHPGGAFGTDYAARLATLPVSSRGFLTGSIDLVFTAADPEGRRRWWVADWKSNWLGRRDGDGRPLACGPRHYGPAAMAALMAASHYPLQAHLYLVALHRYLAWRLPDYAPERHLGGYAYVFLRGTPGAAAADRLPAPVPGMFVERPPLPRLLALDQALGRLHPADP